jgi:hypothetical protein
MCSYNTLHLNEDGYVISCNGCNHLQLAFGTTVLILTRNEFSEFCEMVEDRKNLWDSDGFPMSKCIYIPTKNKDVALVFSYKELLKLHHILVSAGLILETEEILSNGGLLN